MTHNPRQVVFNALYEISRFCHFPNQGAEKKEIIQKKSKIGTDSVPPVKHQSLVINGNLEKYLTKVQFNEKEGEVALITVGYLTHSSNFLRDSSLDVPEP